MKMNWFRTIAALVLCAVLLCAGAAAFSDDGNIGEPYRGAVAAMTEKGILAGFDDGTFGPEKTLTREQGAKIITYILLGAEKAEQLVCESAPFADVPVTLWSAPYVAWCVENDVILGYDDGLFHPLDELTGYQFAKMLLCALDYGVGSDYTGDRWPSGVVEDGNAHGLFAGDAGMASDVPLQRQQAALLAWNALPDEEESESAQPDGSAADPAPAEPAPSDPSPWEFTPSDPAPSDPAPWNPPPADPTPSDPTPADPTPADPTPPDVPPQDPANPGHDDSGDIVLPELP